MPETEQEFSLALPEVNLHGLRRGAHPETVFLHGFGGNLHTWDAVLQYLGEDFPALRYDQRGFGESGWDAETPYDHADDLLAVLDFAGIARADLVGLSQGGATALNFALRHPGRVRRLVLVSPGMVAWEWSDDWRWYWRSVTDLARAGDMDAARELWWRNPLFDSTRDGPAGPAVRAEVMRYAGHHWLADPHVRALPDVEQLHHLQVPTLLLTGGLDLPDFRLIADLIAGSAPQVERVDFPRLGHLLHSEDPAACARHISAFLAKN